MARTIQPDGHLHGVTVACQDQNGRWLLIRRSATVPGSLRVCFPGGGIDGEETQTEAVVREMREEIAAEVLPVRCVWHYRFEERAITLWGWLAELHSVVLAPNPDEVDEILWLTADEVINHPDVLPHTDKFMAALQRTLNRFQFG